MSRQRTQAEYDEQSDALYLRLRFGRVACSIEIDDFCAVDFDGLGELLGIEVLTPRRHFDLAGPAWRYGFATRLTEIEDAAEAAVPGLTTARTHSLAALAYHVNVASHSGFSTGAVAKRTQGSDHSYELVFANELERA